MSIPYTSDAALLEALALSERKALEEVYKRYHDTLVHWITARGGLEADAEDVFQEAILILFEKSKDPDFCLSAALGTYFFGIAKRIWFKKSEKKNVTFEIENEDGELRTDIIDDYELDLAFHMEREENINVMYQSLDKLGSPCSDLLKAFYIDNNSMQEIADRFKYTNAENAKTQKYKCLNRLKKLFFNQGKKSLDIS